MKRKFPFLKINKTNKINNRLQKGPRPSLTNVDFFVKN